MRILLGFLEKVYENFAGTFFELMINISKTYIGRAQELMGPKRPKNWFCTECRESTSSKRTQPSYEG